MLEVISNPPVHVRTCPICNQTIEHKSKVKCAEGIKFNKPCTRCNRSMNGKKNAAKEPCPMCGTVMNTAGVEANHGSEHGTDLAGLWRAKHGLNAPPKCKCGCGNDLTFFNWKVGYYDFILGHNARIWTSFDEEKARDISERRKAKLRGRPSWSKGKTKETDERLAASGPKKSESLKQAYASGSITPWSKGRSKETDERLANFSEKLKQDFASGARVQWHLGKTADTDERIKHKNDSLKEKYSTGEFVPWHKGKTKEEDPRIAKTWEHRDPAKEYANQRFSHEEIESQLQSNVQLALDSIENYRSANQPALKMHCRDCNWFGKVSLMLARTDRCPDCSPKGSNAQIELTKWISDELQFSCGTNVRGIISNRHEIDIFIPEKKFAIEYNGLYYHNEAAGKGQHYHQNKTNACGKLQIQLFHVFEDEWNKKKDIIKSMLMHKLGKTPTKIGARKCSLVIFFNSNHIDGDVPASHAFALKFNNEVVAAMSVRKPFHKKYANFLEIGRSCVKTCTSVQGAVQRLSAAYLEYSKNHGYSGLMTYVDCRFGSGSGWLASGWKKIGETPERFWWTDCHERFNRFKFKANKSANLTEADVAEENNVNRIWGCKNLVLQMT